MMSTQQIVELSNRAARKAAREKKIPYTPANIEEIKEYATAGHPFPFPNLGSHIPRGWKLVETFMCDSSGFGSEDEPALTINGFRNKLLADHEKGYGYAVVQAGEFQVIMGAFEERAVKSKKKS